MSSPFSQLRAYSRYMRYQGYQGIPVEQFNGLDLRNAPDESAAVDLLNVDLDRHGAVRSRDGYAKFTSSAAADAYHSVAAFYTTTGTRQLIAARPTGLDALNTSGGVVATQAGAIGSGASAARFSAPGSEFIYVAALDVPTNLSVIYRWDGATWTTPTWTGTTPAGRLLSTWGDRLVSARYGGSANGNSPSTVRFSNISAGPPPAAQPQTWNANDFIELWPGDGEEITGVVTWRELLFVFKESKFAVFFGTSIDSTGNPIFNWRPLRGEGMASADGDSSYRALTASPDGVYFLNRRGVWFTNGGAAQLVSGAIDPIFRGIGAPSFWAGGVLNQASITTASLSWYDNRLYLSYPTGSNTYNDSLFVFDPRQQTWLYWNLPMAQACPFRVGNSEEMLFAYPTGSNNVGRFNFTSGYTQDGGNGTSTGAAITSRYRSGFLHQAGGAEGRVREAILQGIGTVTFKGSTDWGALNTGESVTMGTSPAIAEGRARGSSFRGRNFSWQVSGTGAWTLERLVLMLGGARGEVEE